MSKCTGVSDDALIECMCIYDITSQMSTCTQIHTIHTFVYRHTCIHTYIHTYMFTFIHSVKKIIQLVTHALTHSLTNSPTHSFIHSVSHSIIHSFRIVDAKTQIDT